MAPTIEPSRPDGRQAHVLRVAPEQDVGEQAADERPDDAQHDGGEDAHRVIPGHHGASDEAGDEADDEHDDDEAEHGSSVGGPADRPVLPPVYPRGGRLGYPSAGAPAQLGLAVLGEPELAVERLAHRAGVEVHPGHAQLG